MLPEYEKQTGVKVEWEEVPYAELLSKQMAELIAKTDRYDLFNFSNKFVRRRGRRQGSSCRSTT